MKFSELIGKSKTPSEGTSLSSWNQQNDVRDVIPWVVMLLLFALFTYYLSRPKPEELQKRAVAVLQDLKQLQEQKAEAQALNLLLSHLRDEEDANFTRGISQHLSHALFVACFLILVVEVHSRRSARRDMQRHVDDVTKNVFQGVSQRLLGECISSELKAILLEDFVKENAGYHLTFERLPDGGDTEWIIVQHETWYDIRSLSREQAGFPFRTSLLGYHRQTVAVDGEQVEFPHFVKVEVDNKEVPLKDLEKDDDRLTLFKEFPFPADTSPLKVKVVARFLHRAEDSIVFSSTYAIEKSSVFVSNQLANLVGNPQAVVLHKHTEGVKPRTSGQWEFSRALLPGQGWFVCWEKLNPTVSSRPVQAAAAVTMTPPDNVTMTPPLISVPPSTS